MLVVTTKQVTLTISFATTKLVKGTISHEEKKPVVETKLIAP